MTDIIIGGATGGLIALGIWTVVKFIVRCIIALIFKWRPGLKESLEEIVKNDA